MWFGVHYYGNKFKISCTCVNLDLSHSLKWSVSILFFIIELLFKLFGYQNSGTSYLVHSNGLTQDPKR